MAGLPAAEPSRHGRSLFTSGNGVTIEQITDLVCRHQLKPVISTDATAMNTIFNKKSA